MQRSEENLSKKISGYGTDFEVSAYKRKSQHLKKLRVNFWNFVLESNCVNVASFTICQPDRGS